jgi:hypothetical protein
MKIELKSWGVLILIALSLLFLHCPFFAESSGIELLSDAEDISARNATTRIYNRNYEIDQLDENGDPTGESYQETRTIMEKADGLCYDSSLNQSSGTPGVPVWEPTVTNFETDALSGWKIDKGPLKVRIASSADSVPLVSLSIPFRKLNSEGEIEKSQLFLRINAGYLAWYDAESTQTIMIDSPRSVSGNIEGNRIIFENAFSCGDLELVYEKGSFHQNVIIRNAGNLPAPELSGISSSNAELRVVTEIVDDSATTAGITALLDDGRGALAVIEGDKISGAASELIFKTAFDKALCVFAPSRAWIGNDKTSARFMNKTITASILDSKKFMHSEGVPYSYITENFASGAITLDYEVRSSSAPSSEAWQPGITYWISDTYTFDSDKTLVIEGGAIVKLGATLEIDEGNLMIKGTPFNYALFVDDNYTSVGESIANPVSNGSIPFIEIHPTSTSVDEIQFAKFLSDTSSHVIWVTGGDSLSGELSLYIRDSIFRSMGIKIEGSSQLASSIDMTLECFNCLFAGDFNDTIYQGAFGCMDQAFHLNLYNCTFARDEFEGYSRAVYITGNSFYNITTELIVKNCLFTEYNYGMECNSNVNIEQDSVIEYNGTEQYDAEDLLGYNLSQEIEADNTLSNLQDIYFDSPNGDYYLCEAYSGQSPSCSSAITGGTDDIPSDYLSRLQKTTVFRPVNINSTEIGNYNSNPDTSELKYIRKSGWNDFWSDTSGIALGFHYDIVHGVVNGLSGMSMTRAFDLQEGCVISFTEFSFWLFDAESNIKGNPVKRNVFNQVASTGDAIKDPRKIRDNLIPSGIGITRGTIDFSEFAFLYAGVICYNEDYPVFIRNTVFRENLMGIGVSWEHRKPVYVENCLFTGNKSSALYCSLNYSDNGLNLVGNTFSDNAKAVYILNPSETDISDNILMENNIFFQNDTALEKWEYDPQYQLTINSVARNNLFWNNAEEDVDSGIDLSDETNLCRANESSENPMFAHRWRSGDDLDVVENWMQDKDIGFDGYYLSQRSGDASRTPLILEEDEEIVDMTVYDLNSFNVFIATALPVPDEFPDNEGINTDTYRIAMINSELSYGSQTEEGPVYLALSLFDAKEPVTIEGNPRVEIELASGDILTIHLPVGEEVETDCWFAFWVTGDGSTYYAHSSQEEGYASGGVSAVFDMDAFFAARWEDDNLARGAFDARLALAGGSGNELTADSPAVDSGSKDWLSGGTTSTDYDISEGVIIPDPAGTNPNDNPPPNKLGDFDNQDSSGAVISWEDEDSNTYNTLDELDMGYHYWAAMYDDEYNLLTGTYSVIDGDYPVALRHPKDAIGKKWSDEFDTWIYPEFGFDGLSAFYKRIALSSGIFYNQESTIACYTTSGIIEEESGYNDYLFIHYHKFRKEVEESEIARYISYIPPELGARVWPTVIELEMKTSDNNVMYLGANVGWLEPLGGSLSTGIKIYRYDPEEDDEGTTWTYIGNLFFNNYTSFERNIIDVSLAPEGNDLNIFWVEDDDQGDYTLQGYSMINAATMSFDDFTNKGNSIRAIEPGNSVHTDWDPNIEKPRICWTEMVSGVMVVNAGRVEFYDGQPDSIDFDYTISDNTEEHAFKPVLVVNHGTSSGDIKEAFSCYTNDGDAYQVDLNVVSGGDVWSDPYSVADRIEVGETDITYQSFGTSRNIRIDYDNKLATNTGVLDSYGSKYTVGAKICTNRGNRKEIYCAYKQYRFEDQKIMIQQLEP